MSVLDHKDVCSAVNISEQQCGRNEIRQRVLLPDKEGQLSYEELTDRAEALHLVNQMIVDPEYADWKERIPDFLENYVGNWRMIKILSPEKQTCGFVILSKDHGKLNKWSKKFLTEDWIKEPIDLEHSLQFAYFYMSADQRGRGYGKKSLESIKERERKAGIKKIYGFSRYKEVIPLYQKTGAKILNKTEKDGQVRTYYYWDLE